MNNYNTPAEIIDVTANAALTKAKMPILKMLFLGIVAGVFIAMGAAASAVAMHGVADVGLQRLVCGLVFPVGLILIVTVGAELFTGNCLMIAGIMEKKISVLAWVKDLSFVWIGNLIGSILIAALVMWANTWNYSAGALGAFTIKVAVGKATMPLVAAFTSGILCNVLVCGAVLLANGAKDIIGKIFGAFFPIFAFVVAGFEHSVANMYYLFAGLFASLNPTYVQQAQDLYNIGPDKIAHLDLLGMIANLAPVSLGNLVGGALLGFLLWLGYKSRLFNKPAPQADQAKA